MKKSILPCLLALCLLAGCTPAAEDPSAPPPPAAPTAVPTAEPTPAPTPEAVDLQGFLDDVNAQRRAVTQAGETLDAAPYCPDFSAQNHTYTEGEMAALTTPHGAKADLTQEDLLADAETFLTLLKTTYGAYWYFGGDEAFNAVFEDIRADIRATGVYDAKTLERILVRRLAPVLTDGHFAIGSTALRESCSQYMYYVPDLYFYDTAGLDMNYVKPTIDGDGRICWWYAALSADGADLPGELDGRTLKWKKAGTAPVSRTEAFAEEERDGVPILISRTMYAQNDRQEEQLERFAACGGEYADAPLLMFDLRGNGGGSDIWVMQWFQGWTGQAAQPRRSGGQRYSQLSCRQMPDYNPAERMGTWRIYSYEGRWVERQGLTFVLTDKGAASSGETAVRFLRTAENTLFVGGPTMGCGLVANNLWFYLPNSGLGLYFGTGVSFCETAENRDGVGWLPDLWVDPEDAPQAVERLIQYYGLKDG